MTFVFSAEDRVISVNQFCSAGFYLETTELLIEANTGLPANSTTDVVPAVSDNHIAVYENNQWLVKVDYRTQAAYDKGRKNGGDYIIIDVGNLPDTHTLVEPSEFDSWTDAGWRYDIDLERPVKTIAERHWRDSELANALSRIDQYEKDKNYPEVLRTSPIKSDADFLKLLQDRKVLSDYPDTPDFPFCTRPTLSGLV